MLRQGERTEESIISGLAGRLKDLEQASTRRMLPPNYEFIVVSDQLQIRRVSDGVTVAIL